jgi:hypothetical protein
LNKNLIGNSSINDNNDDNKDGNIEINSNLDLNNDGSGRGAYSYLLDMSIRNLTEERAGMLLRDADKAEICMHACIIIYINVYIHIFICLNFYICIYLFK